jgi:hypothetical protein
MMLVGSFLVALDTNSSASLLLFVSLIDPTHAALAATDYEQTGSLWAALVCWALQLR